MKKQFYLLITLLVLLLMACSPVLVDNLPKEAPNSLKEEPIVTVKGPNSIEVSFSPVAYATSYGYKINDEEIIIAPQPSFIDGKYVFSISDIQEGGTGEITIYAGNNTNKPNEMSAIATVQYVMSLENVKPDAYVARRNETSAEIIINTSINPKNVNYKVEGIGNQEQIFDNNTSNTLTITGLTANDTYTIKVYHKLTTDTTYGSNYAELYINTYDENISAPMSLNVSNQAFTISGIPEGITSVNLYKKKDNSTSSDSILIYSNAQVSSEKATINISSLKSLESGYFYVSANDASNKTVVSNMFKYTTPLMTVSTPVINYKSVVLPINFADDIDSESLTFSISGAPNATAKAENGKITISGLDSNTDYGSTLSIKPTNAEYATVESMTINNVKTKSFAGDDPVNGKSYEWVGKVKGFLKPNTPMSFVIKVTKSADNSDYPYYVHYSEDDPICKSYNTDLRIMPLIDKAAGDEILNIQAPYPYGGTTPQQYAYKANSEKWNSFTSVSPDSWKLNNNPEITKDRVKTTTITNALIGETTTDTTFEFMEYYDGETYRPVIKFKNMGTGSSASTVNGFLYTNSYNNNNGQEGEKYNDPLAKQDSIYCFYLTERESN